MFKIKIGKNELGWIANRQYDIWGQNVANVRNFETTQ
jgi:hypothetical protein